jgi:phosphoglucosamine mutase
MSNLGFNIAMREHGIEVISAAVGDRYVLEEMRIGGFTIGGEQSGHVVLSEFATTGDGVLTALHLMSEMKRTQHSLAELAGLVNRLPQVLINVPNVDKAAVVKKEVSSAVSAAKSALGETGRVLLRPSGTEPLIRVMVEAATAEQAQLVAQELAAVVAAHCAIAQR